MHTQHGAVQASRGILVKKIVTAELEAVKKFRDEDGVLLLTSNGDIVDLAQSNESLERVLREKKRRSDQIAILTQTLYRLQNGWEGDCLDCGEEIPVQRIQKVPGATRCVRCQAIVEKK